MGERWIESIGPDMDARLAAARVIGSRFADVAGVLAKALPGASKRPSERVVHALRVTTRRADAALHAFEAWTSDRRAGKAGRILRRLRRAAGRVRDADVHMAMLADMAPHAEGEDLAAVEFLTDRLRRERRKAERGLAKTAKRCDPSLVRRASLKVRASLRKSTGRRATALDAARAAILPLIAGAREAASHFHHAGTSPDAEAFARLHELRLAVKPLRYVMEIFAGCFGPALRDAAFPALRELQTRLGEVNDAHSLAVNLRALAAGEEDQASSIGPATHARVLIDRFDAVAALRLRRFVEWATPERLNGWLDELDRMLAATSPLPPAEPALPPPTPGTAERLAVIDIGSNSVRLRVADVSPAGAMSIVADRRETTRLGGDLAASGALTEESMERSIDAVARFARTARELGATRHRAIATAAMREARNRDEFLRRAGEAGVQVEVISPVEEARLAFNGAGGAFDLAGQSSAVIDIGGGSVEVVLGVRGAIWRVASMPLGAVRLTQHFGGAEACSGPRFAEMREHIDDTLKRSLGKVAQTPEIAVGSGGTFTALGLLSAAAAGYAYTPGAGSTRPPIARREVRRLLDELRALPPDARSAFPGMLPDRSDIIVAGLAVVHRLLRHLGAARVHVHDGGLREGALRAMIEHHDGDPVVAARRFAASVGDEIAHSEQVRALALSVFDQLRATGLGPSLGETDRRLLELGALLHDVGIAVRYRGHHKHSAAMIRYAGLPGLESTEVEAVSLMARFHRRTGPAVDAPEFAALGGEERARILRLIGILRVADGLDRSHQGTVRAVTVEARDGECVLHVDAAGPWEPERRAASAKADVFEAAYGVKVRLGPAQAAETVAAEDAAPPTSEDA